jgi:hypothetical protein
MPDDGLEAWIKENLRLCFYGRVSFLYDLHLFPKKLNETHNIPVFLFL